MTAEEEIIYRQKKQLLSQITLLICWWATDDVWSSLACEDFGVDGGLATVTHDAHTHTENISILQW